MLEQKSYWCNDSPRSLRGDLIETYKILTGNEKINFDQLFQKATTTELRGHSLKLYNKSSRQGRSSRSGRSGCCRTNVVAHIQIFLNSAGQFAKFRGSPRQICHL